MPKEMKEQLTSVDAYVSMAIGLAVVLLIGALVINYFNRAPKNTQVAPEEQKAAEQPSPTRATAASSNTHVVKTGETLWSICEEYYKNGYKWTEVAKANGLSDPNLIKTGMSLAMPELKPVAESKPEGQISAASTDSPAEKTYTVVKGDNLWSIAVKQYGNGYKWTDIARANNLTHPGTIHAGNVLTLP